MEELSKMSHCNTTIQPGAAGVKKKVNDYGWDKIGIPSERKKRRHSRLFLSAQCAPQPEPQGDQDLQNQNGRDPVAEALVEGFVVEDPHAQQGAGAAA